MNKVLHSLSIRYKTRLCINLSILALFLGGIIYVLFRASEPVFFGWLRTAGLGNWLYFVRQTTLNWSLYLPDWLIYSLPDGLWAFGYALLISSIWAERSSGIRYLWLASIPVLVLGFEGLQYPGIVSGTFCVEDLIVGTIGLTSGIVIGLKYTKTKRYEKSV